MNSNNKSLYIDQAPMEGVIDFVMRETLSRLRGIDRFVTEFIRVTDQLLPESTYLKYCPELKADGRTAEGTPVFVQLLGSRPEWLGKNAERAVQLGAQGVDLNFGCPAKTVNRHDGGAILLKTPSRVYECIKGVCEAVGDRVPVTAKVRLGFDHKDFHIEIAQAAERAGAKKLTVHARTKLEGYQPPAHWNYLAWIRQSVSVPVVANGEIWTPEDFTACKHVSGCTHFALGRGLVARPSLARELHNEPFLLWQELQNEVIRFAKRTLEVRHEGFAVARVKQWLKFLSRTYPIVVGIFERVKTQTCLNDILKILERSYECESQNVYQEQLPLLRSCQIAPSTKSCSI